MQVSNKDSAARDSNVCFWELLSNVTPTGVISTNTIVPCQHSKFKEHNYKTKQNGIFELETTWHEKQTHWRNTGVTAKI